MSGEEGANSMRTHLQRQHGEQKKMQTVASGDSKQHGQSQQVRAAASEREEDHLAAGSTLR